MQGRTGRVRPTCQSAGGCIHKERMCRNHNRPSPRVGAFSAMQNVGTYRQVRPLCKSAGGCIHKERMRRNHNRPSPRVGAFSAMQDVGTYRPGASDVSTHRRICPQRTDVSESPPSQYPRRCVSVMRDVGTYRPGASVGVNPPADMSTKNGCVGITTAPVPATVRFPRCVM